MAYATNPSKLKGGLTRMLTPIQLRAKIESTINQRLRLRLYEQVVKVNLTDDTCTILTEGFIVEHLARETRYKGRYQRMMEYVYKARPDMPGVFYWQRTGEMKIPDPDFIPIAEATHRRVLTPVEWHDKRNFEASCYRPGTKNFPMDNYDRAMIEPGTHDFEQSPPKMRKHWSK